MEKMTKQQRHFMDILESQNKKKISVNLSEETIQKIDDLAKGLNLTRTAVMECLIVYGLKPYLDTAVSVIGEMAKKQPKKEELRKALESIKQFQKKWQDKYYD